MLHMDLCITLVYAAIVGGALWAAARLATRGLRRVRAVAPVAGGRR